MAYSLLRFARARPASDSVRDAAREGGARRLRLQAESSAPSDKIPLAPLTMLQYSIGYHKEIENYDLPRPVRHPPHLSYTSSQPAAHDGGGAVGDDVAGAEAGHC